MSEEHKFRCRDCGQELVWGNDFTYEDENIEEEDGIVSIYSCLNDLCDVDIIKIYTKIESK
tara:strand:- start:71 stop:253 length:183 start_codon:yes stop_codon:yes gene_type:complete